MQVALYQVQVQQWLDPTSFMLTGAGSSALKIAKALSHVEVWLNLGILCMILKKTVAPGFHTSQKESAFTVNRTIACFIFIVGFYFFKVNNCPSVQKQNLGQFGCSFYLNF